MKSWGWTMRNATAIQNPPVTRHPTLPSPRTITTDHAQFRGWQWRHTTKQTARLRFDTVHFAQRNTHNHRRGLILLSTTQKWRTEGRGGCSNTTPRPKFWRPSKIVQKSTRLWKLLKITEFKTPTHQDVRKKDSKILKLPRFAIVVH